MRQRAAAAASKAAAALARSAALALASSLVVPLWAARRRASALQAQLDALLRVGGTCEAPASPSLPREQGRATVPAASLSPPGSPGPATAHAVASLTLLLLIAIPFLVAAALRRASAAAHAVLHAGGKRPGHSLAALASYRLGAWVASSPASRPLILMALTAYFGGVGCLALFALTPVAARVGGEAGGGGAGGGRALSLTDTAWITVAGLGLDWRFVHDGLGGAAGGVGTLQRLVGLLVSVAGMLCTAFLVGLMTDSLTRALDSLRQGHGSTVLETGHSLVLGWSDKLVPMLTELAAANESEGGGVVVVLAERDKLSMDADVARSLPARLLRGTRVVCRSGSPMLVDDLEGVSAHAAKTVIVLADEGPEAAGGGGGVSAETKDASTLRVVLSLAHLSAHGGLAGPVVAEVCFLDNVPLINLVGASLMGQALHTVVSHDVIGRLMLQCARQPGLAVVFEDLLGFDGSEIYHRVWPQLSGVRFGELPLMLPDAIPIGLVRLDGTVQLRPEDNDSYTPRLRPPAPAAADGPAAAEPQAPCPPFAVGHSEPEAILFVGWRRDLQDLIVAVDEFVQPGSQLWLFCGLPVAARVARLRSDGLADGSLRNLTLTHVVGDPVSRRDLSELPLELFDSVLLLASSASSDGEIFASAHAAAAAAGPAGGGAAGGWGGAGGGAGFAGRHSAGGEFVTPSTTDSKTLASLLLIRDIQAARMEAEREQLARGGPSASSSPADVAAGGGGPTIGASASRSLGRVASVGRSAPAPDRLAAVRAAAVALSQPGGGAGSGAGAAPAPRARSCGSGIRGGGGGFGARFSAAAAPEPASPVPASPSIGGIAARVGAAAGSPPRPRGVPTSASSRAAGLWASGGELNAGGCPVVAEILDSRTRNLVAETGVGDYVLSNSLVSRVLAMVGEDALVADVLAELFSADGSELYVVPARSLVGRAGERASFNELSRRARERGDILLGAYCGEAQGAPGWPRGGATRGGLHGKEGGSDEAEVRAAQRRAMLNPPDKHVRRSWRADDFFVLLADYEGGTVLHQ